MQGSKNTYQLRPEVRVQQQFVVSILFYKEKKKKKKDGKR